jgi:hypothetical protein
MKKKIKNGEFLKHLFDFSFKKFITTRVIAFIFWVNVILAGILGILIIIGGFKETIIFGILALILVPVCYIVYVSILRVILELMAVIFRIGEYVEDIVENVEKIEGKKKE